MHDLLQRALYRYGWDTRCRNLIPARLIRSLMGGESPRPRQPVLLDVGCGRIGLAGFLPDVSVVGLDVEQPVESAPNFTFQPGSVTALPFADGSFPFVSCVDVLEHLPLDVRELAVGELTRVASRGVLIAAPHGETAQGCDEEFRRELTARKRPVPGWVDEHLRQPYPTSSEVVGLVRRAAAAQGRAVKISLSYSEPISACRLVRRSAARSGALYTAVNFLMGVALPVIPAPGAGDSYRTIILAEFVDGAAGVASPEGFRGGAASG
jgi:SAM-dependent methyltransferase